MHQLPNPEELFAQLENTASALSGKTKRWFNQTVKQNPLRILSGCLLCGAGTTVARAVYIPPPGGELDQAVIYFVCASDVKGGPNEGVSAGTEWHRRVEAAIYKANKERPHLVLCEPGGSRSVDLDDLRYDPKFSEALREGLPSVEAALRKSLTEGARLICFVCGKGAERGPGVAVPARWSISVQANEGGASVVRLFCSKRCEAAFKREHPENHGLT